ncbi:MAG: TRASH domain protein [Proteobacteria bacterium]|nr:TRASH domain protein [Pseudomonadota bacterium]MBU1737505.1 TRASH domain protein [Pseudomonadota bacterium]
MTPIRIVILTLLFYILYRLLTGSRKKGVASKPRGGELPAQDVLVEDPVCHTYIPMKQAVTEKFGATVHYFCSQECRKKYTATQQGDQK